jgi:hypothetical protein
MMLEIPVLGRGLSDSPEKATHTEAVISWLEEFGVPLKAVKAGQVLRWTDGVLEADCFVFESDGKRKKFHMVDGHPVADGQIVQFPGVGRPSKEISSRVGN